MEDLLRELEGPMPVTDNRGGDRVPPALPPAGTGGFPVRLLLALLVVAMGFGAGWMAAGSRVSLAGAGAPKGGGETRSDLLADGWAESDQGVFTRRCRGNCRRPTLYGGGVADVMEVSCLERPCGDIRAVFDVLDGQGQVIEQIPLQRPGLQGERLQLLLESEKPQARRFVLREFRAKARVY